MDGVNIFMPLLLTYATPAVHAYFQPPKNTMASNHSPPANSNHCAGRSLRQIYRAPNLHISHHGQVALGQLLIAISQVASIIPTE
jgi:hypothetical protein